MATMKIMQGDSVVVFFTISMDDAAAVTPNTAEDIEVCVGTEDGALIRNVWSAGEVGYDEASGQWYFRLTQSQTLDLEPDVYEVLARVRFGEDVRGVVVGRIMILAGQSSEVI